VRDQARRLGAHIVEYIDAHADANAAAELYAGLMSFGIGERVQVYQTTNKHT
jgi:hypothetical protein